MTLYIFDKDGTLVGGLSNRPANTPDEQQPLPGVVAKIAELRAANHEVAVASNQGGVSWGFITSEQAHALMLDVCQKCGISEWNYEFCPYDVRGKYADFYFEQSKRRKPEPGMLLDLMDRLGYEHAATIMIGDQDSDKQAAEAAGIRFEWAADFFGWR